jgi:hypothetical protein
LSARTQVNREGRRVARQLVDSLTEIAETDPEAYAVYLAFIDALIDAGDTKESVRGVVAVMRQSVPVRFLPVLDEFMRAYEEP